MFFRQENEWTNKNSTVDMGSDGTFYKGVFIFGTVFLVGFATGYKAKKIRMEYLKRRRERL